MLDQKRAALLEFIGRLPSCAVAFSAGVDSTVVAQAARLALGQRAVAVTAVSPSLPQGELEAARELARRIGIRHYELATSELENEQYTRNASDRCYHCKNELYLSLAGLAGKLDVAVLLNGANVDDLGDYRPGMQAAAEHQVLSPLVECGITKEEVRQLARQWRLPVWDKPASPCLSSRVAYGEEVTPERLRRIDLAEQFLRRQGISPLRVRLHRGETARIEVPPEHIARLCSEPLRSQTAGHLRQLGFRYVTVDLDGLRSGSLNGLIEIEGKAEGGRRKEEEG